MNYSFWIRLIISVVVAGIILRTIDWKEFPEFNDVQFGYIAIAGLFSLLNRFINVYRWHMLINQSSSTVSFMHVLEIYFKSGFVGLVLPSSVGGELLKGYGLMKSGSGGIDSFSSILMERLLGFITLLMLPFLGLLFLDIHIEGLPALEISRTLVVIMILMLVGIVCGYVSLPWIVERLQSYRKVTSIILRLKESFLYYQGIKVKICFAFFLSFLIQFFRILSAWMVGVGFGVTLGFAYYVLLVPIVLIIAMIPISIAGLGVQEGAFVYLFSLTGTSPSILLAMALVLRVIATLVVLPGGILYVKDGLWKKPIKQEV